VWGGWGWGGLTGVEAGGGGGEDGDADGWGFDDGEVGEVVLVLEVLGECLVGHEEFVGDAGDGSVVGVEDLSRRVSFGVRQGPGPGPSGGRLTSWIVERALETSAPAGTMPPGWSEHEAVAGQAVQLNHRPMPHSPEMAQPYRLMTMGLNWTPPRGRYSPFHSAMTSSHALWQSIRPHRSMGVQ
jgi:hypothetical protein